MTHLHMIGSVILQGQIRYGISNSQLMAISTYGLHGIEYSPLYKLLHSSTN